MGTTEAQLADGTLQKYTFDSNGNRKTMTVTKDGTETITEYAYDLNDRLLSETENGVTTTYSYDNNGNMLGKSDGTSVVTQTFDLLNRMTSFSDGETTATYTYNPDNMRRSKTVNGVKTEHVWVGSDIALDITGSSVVSYVQGIKSNYGWYVYNAHGDVVQLCDNNGVVTKSYDYDPYGNQLTETDALDKNPYRYSGEYYDAESGYIYLRSRYYDSATGRFISEDPAFDGFNWYAYCGGNPLNRWDPSGQAWYDWVPGMLMTGAGVAMCATGFGAPAGIGLIAGGTSWLTTSALGAAGFDSKFVSMATAGLDVVGGAALLLTPFAPLGAGMIGSGFGSLAGGAISEKLCGSYELGANIGSIVGGFAGVSAYYKISAMKAPNTNHISQQAIKNRYPNETQSGKRFEYNISDGNLKIRDGINEVDFVVDMDGNLHIGRGHSYLANGRDVQAAGTLKVNHNGQIRRITNASGHYAPTVYQGQNYPSILNNAGLSTKNAWLILGDYQLTSSGYVDVGKTVYYTQKLMK